MPKHIHIDSSAHQFETDPVGDAATAALETLLSAWNEGLHDGLSLAELAPQIDEVCDGLRKWREGLPPF